MIDPIDDDAALERTTHFCRLRTEEVICDSELVNEFCTLLLFRANVGAALPCFSRLPNIAKDMVIQILKEHQVNDFPYFHHLSRWHPTEQQWDQRRPHMREVAARLLGS